MGIDVAEGTQTGRPAAVYARVSTEQQTRGTSLAEQVRLCTNRALADSHTDIVEYVDGGVSGTLDSRAGLDRMMTAVEAGDLAAVYVHHIDRLSRGGSSGIELIERILAADVGLVALTAPDLTTSGGQLSGGILALVAKWQRDQIVERGRQGQLARWRAGKWPGGIPPYGYRLVNAADGEGVVAVPDPVEAGVVRAIYECLVDRRLSTGDTAVVLSEAGHEKRTGGEWRIHNVRFAVDRHMDAWGGEITWGERTVAVPPIFSTRQMDALREVRKRAPKRAQKPTSDYLLGDGRLRSPHGQPMYRQENRRVPWYRCRHAFTSFRQLDGVARCDCHSLHVEETDRVVWTAVAEALRDPGVLDQIGAERLGPEVDDRVESMTDEIVEMEARAADEMTDLLDEGVSPAVAARAGRRYDGRVEALQRELGALRRQRGREEAHGEMDLPDLVLAARSRIDDLSPAEQRDVLDALRVRVEVVTWEKCPECGGKGVVAWNKTCPTCLQGRYLAQLRIVSDIPNLL